MIANVESRARISVVTENKIVRDDERPLIGILGDVANTARVISFLSAVFDTHAIDVTVSVDDIVGTHATWRKTGVFRTSVEILAELWTSNASIHCADIVVRASIVVVTGNSDKRNSFARASQRIANVLDAKLLNT
ncbi:MAG: hypothetical protein BVN35_17650 [Proteobacteria bacterium ST_bin11]|nr:MAG: hypothetical protein BVN35_17650 [Proteobacteria bacterium ST_bin11]